MRLPGRSRARAMRDGPSAQLAELLGERLRELSAGEVASVATVARLPIVVSARATIADACASMPIAAVRDGRAVAPTPSLLLRPDAVDPMMTRRRWVHRAAMSLTGWGGLYLGVTAVGSSGWPLSAMVLHPDYVSPEYDTDGRTVIGWRYGQHHSFSWIVYVPLWEFDLGAVAPSPLQACQGAFDDLALLWGFATNYWREGGLPPYVLTNTSRLRKNQTDEALEQWLSARAQRRAGMLTGSWDIKPMQQQSAHDALLLDGLAYIDATVARVFGIVPSILNTRVESGSLTYTNTQEELRRWLNLSLYPTWLARLEDGLTAMLPRGQSAAFDTATFGAFGLSHPGADVSVAAPAVAGPTPREPAPMEDLDA
jgi:phage portal protein BeeE